MNLQLRSNQNQKQLDWLKNEWWANGKILRTKFDVHTCVKANKISWIVKKRQQDRTNDNR